MINTPKSMRLQIGIFGRTNVGKSSILNMIANQDVALTSPIPGTTTDVVEKSMELLPIGPVTILDTAGIDDTSLLSEARIERTNKILDRADVAMLVAECDSWTDFEDSMIAKFVEKNIPYFIVFNKIDINDNSNKIEHLDKKIEIVKCSALDLKYREKYISDIKNAILSILPSDYIQPPPLVGDLMPPGGLCVMIVPIDLQAPKGRLILPQVQAIRDVLDNDAAVMVVKEREYAHLLTKLNGKPDLVICDSQVVMKMVADTPDDVKCSTFSILFSRFKGDIVEEARGAAAIDNLEPGDKILIAESCSHHPAEDDIGRVKIPRWLRQYIGIDVQIDVAAGRDFPNNLSEYKLVIHCGSCMLTRNEKLIRINKAKTASVPITNYGIAISLIQGVLERVLSPFPAALDAYLSAK